MSLRNRARALQKKTGLSYQQALARLRALGERPARLHRESGWPLEVCDRFLVDGHAPIEVLEGRSERQQRIEEICERLRVASNAREVLLMDGRVLVRARVDELESGDSVHSTQVKRAVLVVRFHSDETSLGLVRLRMRQAMAELEPLLDDDDVMMPPIAGGGGTSGVPSEMRVVEPVPATRPKKKPAPIGRKRKR
jgi:hypothetical protein